MISIPATLVSEAKSLIQRASNSCHAQFGLSTTSCQIYDTAWVAMITKEVDGEKQWLFEECFYFLLKAQSDDGSWGSHQATQTVGILDTAASLLALMRHAAEPLQIQNVSFDELRRRIEGGCSSLRSQLATWHDVSATNHIAVELIVPSLLKYLESEDSSLTFEFESKDVLMDMNATKMSRFKPESLYQKKPSSAVHSLEAFIGKIDFDKVSHHLFQGSMMASPSSTAAYLMHASHWDENAEAYLRHVVKAGAGHGDGGIPGTFPTTYFEFSWTLATLLQAGFEKSELECQAMQGMASILAKAFRDDNGIIGFAPCAADVDDTAKGLLALSLLGEPVSPDPMIKVFEADDHFRTFGAERDPSFTSNCHVLQALLHEKDVCRYSSQILKTTEFICNFWWRNDGQIKDKWHLSDLYPTMLMVEGFTELLRLLDQRAITGLVAADLQWKVAISLFQACNRTLLEQQDDGSWSGLPEQTSYAILTLASARSITFLDDLHPVLQSAIDRGVAFLEDCSFKSLDHHWISKTAYRVAFVAEAYHLAALKVCKAPSITPEVGSSLGITTAKTTTKIERYIQLIRRTPLFSTLPEWEIRASLLESALFVPLLRTRRLEVFSRDDAKIEEDKYLDIIPFTWIGCNNRSRAFASTNFLFDMMMISLLGYQIDEFIESTAATAFAENPRGLHELIDETVAGVAAHLASPKTNGVTVANGCAEDPEERQKQSDLVEVKDSLHRFVIWVLGHDSVQAASLWDSGNLRRELENFLHAHATQVEDNIKFSHQKLSDTDVASPVFATPGRPFSQWVRTTAADHVACAYSLAFACCLLSTSLGAGAELFPSAKEKYLMAAASRHLATMCRMYNDLGSVSRDSKERNLNSLHFPEFAASRQKGTSAELASTQTEDTASRKKALAEMAEFEHCCLDQALEHLERETTHSRLSNMTRNVSERKIRVVRYFCDVTDFYDQLYALSDLSSNMKRKCDKH